MLTHRPDPLPASPSCTPAPTRHLCLLWAPAGDTWSSLAPSVRSAKKTPGSPTHLPHWLLGKLEAWLGAATSVHRTQVSPTPGPSAETDRAGGTGYSPPPLWGPLPNQATCGTANRHPGPGIPSRRHICPDPLGFLAGDSDYFMRPGQRCPDPPARPLSWDTCSPLSPPASWESEGLSLRCGQASPSLRPQPHRPSHQHPGAGLLHSQQVGGGVRPDAP